MALQDYIAHECRLIANECAVIELHADAIRNSVDPPIGPDMKQVLLTRLREIERHVQHIRSVL